MIHLIGAMLLSALDAGYNCIEGGLDAFKMLSGVLVLHHPWRNIELHGQTAHQYQRERSCNGTNRERRPIQWEPRMVRDMSIYI